MEQDVEQREMIEEKHKAILRVENVSKTYIIPDGRLRVLQNVHLQVQHGEFIAITGPSGSGKTTLLYLLGALDRGIDAADFRRQQIGFVFQLFYLLPNLTALENVMAPLLPSRRKLDFDLKQRAKGLLESVGLGDRLGHPPARLSGGEQQRVAIARALVNRPKLVLADEPTGNLDPSTGHEVLKVLRELQQTGNQTLIMVTHDPEISAMADRRLPLEQLSRVGT
jgi:ABC-type lipoprotein export system ATPase subunit